MSQLYSTKIDWQGKPYYSLDAFFKHYYGGKCYKIAVDAGCSCPNRDGTIDTRGCIFCSALGSGDFSVPIAKKENEMPGYIDACIESGVARFNKAISDRFVIYFQAFTNTYGDISYLKSLWKAALSNIRVIGISIATRPDCLPDTVMEALQEMGDYAKAMGKFLWIELGLQSIHKKTEEYIRRGYPLELYDEACEKLTKMEIPYIVHVILGLPGESKEMMKETVEYVCRRKKALFGIKLQLLHVLEGTDLASCYEEGEFDTLTMEEYIELLCDIVEIIPEDVVIHRITGDGPKNILIAPKWSGNKKLVLNSLHKRMKERGIKQGSKSLAYHCSDKYTDNNTG